MSVRERLARAAVFGAVGLLMAGTVLPSAATVVATPRTSSGCRVISVIDGDTLRVFCPGRGLESARLLGFDTPEIFSPKCTSELIDGLRAKWVLQLALWRSGKVTMVREGMDRYDRGLYALWLDETPAARRMISGGYARSYDGGLRSGWCDRGE